MTAKLEALARQIPGPILRPAPHLGAAVHVPNLSLVYEGDNPGGSIDDRISLAHVQEALRQGRTTVSAAADGRAATSLHRFASAAGLQTVIHVSMDAERADVSFLKSQGVKVSRIDEPLPALVAASRREAAAEGWYDATLGPSSREILREALAPIAALFRSTAAKAPSTIAVPTRHGHTIPALWAGTAGLVPRPRMIAASTKMGNPIVWSLARQRASCEDLDAKEVWYSATSEALATTHAIEGDACMAAVRESNGWAYAAADKELEELAALVQRHENIDIKPASAAGLGALRFAGAFGRLGDGANIALLPGRP